MGWDITYHPFAPDDVRHVYFRGIEEPAYRAQIAVDFGLDEADTIELCDCLEQAARFGPDTPFNKGHGFALAAVAGYLRKYWYLRGSAFSFVLEAHPEFAGYILDWRALTPTPGVAGAFRGAIEENYSCGVFMSPAGLRKLRGDYERNPTLRASMDDIFSHGRLAVFWKAVEHAVEHGLGLVEATDLVVPNPLDLSRTQCISKLRNCEIEGAYLYAQATLEQIREAKQPPPAQPRKGFLARLLGK